MLNYSYIILPILLTVYSQLIIKWQMQIAGELPSGVFDKIIFLVSQFLNPWIISACVASVITVILWMAAMTKFQISYAYPFLSLCFVFVSLSGAIFLGEPLNIFKIMGIFLIVGGAVVLSFG